MENKTQNPIPEPTPPMVSPVELPKPKNNYILVIFLSVLLIFTILIAGLFYFQIQKLSKELSKYQALSSPTPTPSPITEDKVLAIQTTTCCSCPTKIPRSLIGTNGWVIYEEGKDYSGILPEICDQGACAPCPPLEEENRNKTDCKDPRPEVCTMECIQNPPYICGSDGKSYCSICQACSNKDVAWYEMKASACGD